MSRETHSVNIRADSDCTGKIQCRGACIHFSEAKVKLPRLVARYAKKMGVSYEKVFVKAQKIAMGLMLKQGKRKSELPADESASLCKEVCHRA